MTSIHLNDVGTVINVTITDVSGTAIDISDATNKQIILQPEDGSNKTKSASFTTDGSDGKINYEISGGDIDEPGNWRVQSFIVTPAGSWSSSVDDFNVAPNL